MRCRFRFCNCAVRSVHKVTLHIVYSIDGPHALMPCCAERDGVSQNITRSMLLLLYLDKSTFFYQIGGLALRIFFCSFELRFTGAVYYI